MSETITLESILKEFKPTLRKEIGDILLILKEKLKIAINPKNESIGIRYQSRGDKIKLTVRIGSEKKEVLLEPSEYGLGKSCEILICTRESGLINLQTRRTEEGYFLIPPVTVTLPDVGLYKNKWLFWYKGKMWLVDLNFRDIFTTEFSIDEIQEGSSNGLSDFSKQYIKRVRIPISQYRLLISQKMVYYTISREGNVEAFKI